MSTKKTMYIPGGELMKQLLETIEENGGEYAGVRSLASSLDTDPKYLRRLIRQSGCLEIHYVIQNNQMIGVVKKNE